MSTPSRRSLIRGMAACSLALFAGSAHASSQSGAPKQFEFLALGDFTVNLPPEGRRLGYVVVSITLETKAEETQQFRDLTPRLREAVLRCLMQMSEQRRLMPGHTNPAMLRDTLFDSLAKVREAGLKDVVVTRLLHS